MVTVEEVWRLALPAGTELVAGETSLSREVAWAATLRPAPPGFAGLRGGEVALISTESLRRLDAQLSVLQAVETLADIGVAAVAVAGPVPEEAVERAGTMGTPLFVLPESASLSEVQRMVNDLVTARSAQVYEREQEHYRQLTELAIDGRGLQAIVDKLASITGKLAIAEDQSFDMEAVSQPLNPVKQRELAGRLAEISNSVGEWVRGIRRSIADPPAARFDLVSGQAVMVAPVTVQNTVAGFVSVMGPGSSLSGADRLAVSRAAVACAIELSRRRAIDEAQGRTETAFVDELLASGTQRESSIIERAGKQGFDLSAALSAMVFHVDFDGLERVLFRGTADPARERERRITEALRRELSRRSLRLPVRVKSEHVTILYPVGSKRQEDLKGFAEILRRQLEQGLNGAMVSAGVGSPHAGVAGAQDSYQEAEQALVTGMRLSGPGRVTYFGDLGLYRLLRNLQGAGDLAEFAGEMLGKLVAYDQSEHADLVPTLEAYFDSLNSLSDAARRLHIHRNTMIYRLNRIREITALDLDDPDTRLALHLALKITRMQREGKA